jgi:hypothetical protein
MTKALLDFEHDFLTYEQRRTPQWHAVLKEAGVVRRHMHRAGNGDRCAVCGEDLRSAIHLTISEVDAMTSAELLVA